MNPAPPVTSTRSPTRRRLRGPPARATGRGPASSRIARGAAAAAARAASRRRSPAPPSRPNRRRSAPPPAGRTAPVGHEPEGIAWDAAAGLIAVGVREPPAVAFVDPSSPQGRCAGCPCRRRRATSPTTPPRATVLRPGRVGERTGRRPPARRRHGDQGRHPPPRRDLGRRRRLRRRRALRPGLASCARPPCRQDPPHPPPARRHRRGRRTLGRAGRGLGAGPPGLRRHSLKPLGSTPGRGRPQPHRRPRRPPPTSPTPRATRSSSTRSGRQPALLGKVAAPGTPYGLAIDRPPLPTLGHRNGDRPARRVLAARRTAAARRHLPDRAPAQLGRRRPPHRRGLRRRSRQRADRADHP